MLLQGIYGKTLFRNEKTGYTGFSFIPTHYEGKLSSYGNLICRAIIPHYPEKMPVSVEYDEIIDTTIEAKSVLPDGGSKEVCISFLCDCFDNVGPKLAEKIYQACGPDIFQYALQKNMLKTLKEVPGLSDETSEMIVKKLRSSFYIRDLYTFIHSVGGCWEDAERLFRQYGELALKKIHENPYQTGQNLIPFSLQEKIAKNESKGIYSKERIHAMLSEILSCAEKQGDLYIPYSKSSLDDWQERVLKNSPIKQKIPFALIHTYLYQSSFRLEYDDKEARLYSGHMYSLEQCCVNHALRIQREKTNLVPITKEDIMTLEDEFDIRYGDSQRHCFHALESTGIKIITGGPGSGKTTTIRGLIQAYCRKNTNAKIALCAPTGRASKRMEESTGLSAKTIHRMIEFRPFDNDFIARVEQSSLPYDLIIVDEMSMADIQITALLLNAIKSHCIVLFVGDINQLPSVGAGNVLHDFIESEQFEVYRLDTNYRQSSDSVIPRNADKVLQQEPDFIQNDSFQIIQVKNKTELQQKALEIYQQCTCPLVLTPTKKNEAGTFCLNPLFQQKLPRYGSFKQYGPYKYYRNDSVIFLSNHYEYDEEQGIDNSYYNGDIGLVDAVCDDCLIISLDDRHIVLPNNQLKDIALAYSITIHKSQGSEENEIIILLPQKPSNMLQKNLLYTAITRAKKKVIIISERDAYLTAVFNNHSHERKTKTKENA